MALKDVAVGFGTLPGGLSNWHCPSCKQESQVSEWKALSSLINQRKVDCRQCPICQYLAWSHGDTQMMAYQEEENEKKKKEEAEKAAAEIAEQPKENGQMEVVADPALADGDNEDEAPAEEAGPDEAVDEGEEESEK